MPNKRLSELEPATSLGSADLIPVVQGSVTKKMTGAVLKSFVNENTYVSTMLPTNTASQNLTAFVNDRSSAAQNGKTLFIPAGVYLLGGSVSINLLAGEKTIIRGVPGQTIIKIASGSTASPLIFTTENLWTDHVVSAVATATSGGNMASTSEVSKVTLATPLSSIKPNEMMSLYSNDILLYSIVSPSYELNFYHEMSQALALSGSDVYFSHKLNRTFTTNYCRLRRYNNEGIVFDINDIVFDTDGDNHDATILQAARPQQVFEVIGVKAPRVGAGVKFARAWAGGPSFNSTMFGEDFSSVDDAINGTSAGSVLGYFPRIDGVNFMFKVGPRKTEHGRHLPTTAWLEAGYMTISSTGYVAGSTTQFNYTGVDINNPVAGDQVYIDLSGATGTINTMPVGFYVVTARTGSSTSGTITVNYNSTGKTYTAGTTNAPVYRPSNARRYGECHGLEVQNQSIGFCHGSPIDEHENAIATVVDGVTSRFLAGYTWGSTSGRTVNNRGANSTYSNIFQEGGTQFAVINSFNQVKGLSNIITFNNITLANQQDKAAGGAYFETLGSELVGGLPRVTEYRHLIVNNLTVKGGAYKVLDHVLNAGNVTFNNFNYSGDWGDGANSGYMLSVAGGEVIIQGGVIDLSGVTTTLQVRLAQLTGGGAKFRFKGTYLKGLAATTTPMYTITGANSIAGFEDCILEFSPNATDATSRFLALSAAVTATVDLINCRVINGAKIGANGLFRAATSGGTLNINVSNLVTDAEFPLATATAGATVNVKDQGKVRIVTASGAVTLQNNDHAIMVNKTTGAATTVNLTNYIVGKRYTIKDAKGDAATNNITLTPATGTIDGAASFVMNINYQSVDIMHDGAQWRVL